LTFLYHKLHICLKSNGTFFLFALVVQIVASPADLVKVRMQADGRMVSQGLQPRYSGPFDALNKIVRMEGFGGLWKGVFPNVQRAFLVNMGELACYDHAKRFVIQNKIAQDNIYAHTLASIMSGLSATALSCPADVVKTRMMNQAADKEGRIKYSSSYDCLMKTVRFEGLRALWKGFFPTWARLGPWQFVFWVSYEKFRQIAGLSSF
jgi:solute carrier family 25 uncoupling protein 27